MDNQSTVTEPQVRSALQRLVKSQPVFETKRCERAIQIILNGEINKLPSGNFAAKSKSYGQPVVYSVNPRYEECNCPDFRGGHICKHWIAYEILCALG